MVLSGPKGARFSSLSSASLRDARLRLSRNSLTTSAVMMTMMSTTPMLRASMYAVESSWADVSELSSLPLLSLSPLAGGAASTAPAWVSISGVATTVPAAKKRADSVLVGLLKVALSELLTASTVCPAGTRTSTVTITEPDANVTMMFSGAMPERVSATRAAIWRRE